MMKTLEGFAIVNTSTLFISSVLSSIHIAISAFLTLTILKVIVHYILAGLGKLIGYIVTPLVYPH